MFTIKTEFNIADTVKDQENSDHKPKSPKALEKHQTVDGLLFFVSANNQRKILCSVF